MVSGSGTDRQPNDELQKHDFLFLERAVLEIKETAVVCMLGAAVADFTRHSFTNGQFIL